MKRATRHTTASLLSLGLAGAFGIAPGCGGDTDVLLAALGGDCLVASDCEEGLVCAFRVCHQRCAADKDCPLDDRGLHQLCVSEKPARVCRLDAETRCTLNSDCKGDLVCGNDGRCRNPCSSARDCTDGQRCVGATCVDPDELGPDGTLALAEGQGARGKPCAYTTDCPADPTIGALVCREGVCDAPCWGDDRDCDRFARCTTATPGEPGQCELIGPPGTFYCSPKAGEPDREVDCACKSGETGKQVCNEDGSGYGPCELGGSAC